MSLFNNKLLKIQKSMLDTDVQAEFNKVSVKADKTYVDTVTQSIASGSPKGVYTTVSALQTAFPTGTTGVYLVTADGNWYYWSGSAWTAGGVYQSTGITDYSLTTKKLAFYPVIGNPSKNLFDKTTILTDQYLNYLNGTTFASTGYFVSDYILVDPNTNYYLQAANGARRLVVYDSSKAFLAGYIDGVTSVTTPANAKYIRISSATADLDTTQLEKGSSFSGYEAFGTKFDSTVVKDNSLSGTVLNNNSVIPTKINGYTLGKNLFNKDTVTLDKFIFGNGGIGDSTDYVLSDYIPITPNTDYAANTFEYSSYFDNNKVFISGNGAGLLQTQKSPSNAYFIRVSVLKSMLDTYQFEKGIVSTTYESYNFQLKYLTLKNIQMPTSQRDRLYSFKDAWIAWENGQKFPVGFLGDSTTDGANTTGWSDTTNSHLVQDTNAGTHEIDTLTVTAIPTTSGNITITLNGVATNIAVDPATDTTLNLVATKIRNASYSGWATGGTGAQVTFTKNTGGTNSAPTFGAGTAGMTATIVVTTAGTIGYGLADYINTKAYPYILEQFIKKETGQTVPRIYNIGYSGTYMDWAKPLLNQIFGGVYSDIKMVGITYGINDRTRVNTTKDYEQSMRNNLDYFINYFFNKGIQPFMVTSQATVEPYDYFNGTYPLRTSEAIASVANRVKREMANKYNLEIIEMTDFDEHAFTYGNYTLRQILGEDTLHFADIGHQLEAGFVFSKFCPRVITVKDSEILSFSSQKIKSFVPTAKPSYLWTFEDGFKLKANYTKVDTNDLLMQDFWVLNYSKKALDLKAFLTTVGSQYTKLNDATIPLTSNGQSLGTLDIGLHHIQAYTGATTNVDFKGFTLY